MKKEKQGEWKKKGSSSKFTYSTHKISSHFSDMAIMGVIGIEGNKIIDYLKKSLSLTSDDVNCHHIGYMD